MGHAAGHAGAVLPAGGLERDTAHRGGAEGRADEGGTWRSRVFGEGVESESDSV